MSLLRPIVVVGGFPLCTVSEESRVVSVSCTLWLLVGRGVGETKEDTWRLVSRS